MYALKSSLESMTDVGSWYIEILIGYQSDTIYGSI